MCGESGGYAEKLPPEYLSEVMSHKRLLEAVQNVYGVCIRLAVKL